MEESEKAIDIYEEIQKNSKNVNSFIGYVNMNGNDRKLDDIIPYLGHFEDLEKIKVQYDIDEYIIAIESSEHNKLMNILLKIDDGKARIKSLPRYLCYPFGKGSDDKYLWCLITRDYF